MLNRSASLAIQQAFSKPWLVNLISKDTHLVSIYLGEEKMFGHTFSSIILWCPGIKDLGHMSVHACV